MENLYNTLKHSGLSKTESKVYLSLLKLGSVKAGNISKESELDRTTTYSCLKSLGEKGLVSYVIIGKVKWWQASDPKNFEIYLKDKLEKVQAVLPNLEKIYYQRKLKENVRLFKGNKGVKTVLDDIISESNENCVFGSEGQLEKRLPFYAKRFVAQLEKSGIRVKSLVRKTRTMSYSKFREARSIDAKGESPVVTNIYGNKIAIIVWSDIPEVILIENEAAANSYREYFDFMWKNAKTK
jgi:HTH-type transcriptional regulator, sugar sensing transcriptional regulator